MESRTQLAVAYIPRVDRIMVRFGDDPVETLQFVPFKWAIYRDRHGEIVRVDFIDVKNEGVHLDGIPVPAAEAEVIREAAARVASTYGLAVC